MNDNERIEVLESMLLEEREKASRFIFMMETYARGLDMMARVAYAETQSGSMDEKNAMAVKLQSADTLSWIGSRAEELRGMMGRAMPSGQEEAPSPPGDEDDLADPSIPDENIEQSQAVTIH